jgi:PAS domain S-box-containing protein
MSDPLPATARLVDSKSLFEKLFACSPDAILLVDPEGRIRETNPKVEQLFGYASSELIGHPVEILIPERFHRGHPVHRGDYNKQPRMRPMGAGLDLYGRRKDGSEIAVDIMLSPIETAHGQMVLGVIRDISERKQNDDELRKSRTMFENFFEFSPDAIVQANPDGLIVRVNAQVEAMFGYTRGELIGQPVHMLVPERFRESHILHPRRYQADPHTRPMGVSLELYGRRKDGSEFPVDIMLGAFETEGEPLALAVVRDVTQRKQAEEALRRSEHWFRALFEFSPDAIIASDANGRITQVNSRVETLFGYAQTELLGQSIEILIPERFRRTHPRHRNDYMQHARVRPMGVGLELHGRRKDGTEFPVDIMLSPVETEKGQIVSVIRDLSERRKYEEALKRSEQEKRYLEEELKNEFEEIVGENAGLKEVLKNVETVAVTDATVLILGETGTGKELIARAIHRLSARRNESFIRLNCAAIPGGLLESELFGHEKGAFTGAIQQKVGRMELAHRGTIFLDEVGDLPLDLQPKLLRALQAKEIERLGSTRTIPVDVRLIAATNRDLNKMVADKEFRSDLYYRLRVFPILMPPLRERRDDIPLLVRHFVDSHGRRMKRQISSIPDEVMRTLCAWRWPGNIRELENFIERAVILSHGSSLRAPLSELISEELTETAQPNPTLQSAEREHILRILRETKGMIGGPEGAAARLGVKRTTLNSKLKKLAITRKDYI